MFPFFANNKTAEVPEVMPSPVKTTEPHPLDAMTGGAFSAQTSGERTSCIRDWLASSPSVEHMQAVFKDISGKDKGRSQTAARKARRDQAQPRGRS
jgi:ATP-dependent RNA helicase SUPV3L1/SUV3